MSDKMTRVYHPTGDAWQDVAAGDVKDWTDAGWLKGKPAHVTDADLHPVGSFYPPAVAVEPVEAPTKDAKS